MYSGKIAVPPGGGGIVYIINNYRILSNITYSIVLNVSGNKLNNYYNVFVWFIPHHYKNLSASKIIATNYQYSSKTTPICGCRIICVER
jgi:hypothetical protein